MKGYFRVMLGQGSVYAKQAVEGGYLGVGFDINVDLTSELPDDWREFNKKYIPVYLQAHPDKSRIAAGLACGALWTVSKGIKDGDVVLSPDGSGDYRVGEVTGGYHYVAGEALPHRRPVHWFMNPIAKADVSADLKHSMGSIGTVANVSQYADQIVALIGGQKPPVLVSTDETVEDPTAFAMESHLEDFLVANWTYTALGKEYDIFKEDGQPAGQQYPTDTGPLDILAVSKDGKTLLVVELKKGKASDVVVGQTLRYMGFVQEVLAEPSQSVKGIIIALDEDKGIRRALAVTPNVKFLRYKVHFDLVPA